MPRLLELLLVLLLFVFGLGVVLQWQNQKLLDAILVEMKNRDEIAAVDPTPGTPEAPQPVAPGGAQHANPTPAPDPTPSVDLLAGGDAPPVSPRPEPTAPPQTPEATPDPTPAPGPTPAPTPADSTDSPQWDDYGPQVEKVMSDLLAGEYKAVTAQFDPVFKAQLTEPMIASFFDPLRQEHGSMKRIVRHKRVLRNVADRQTAFEITVEMTDGFEIPFTITIDDKRRITALF